jgi:hypothetical protein
MDNQFIVFGMVGLFVSIMVLGVALDYLAPKAKVLGKNTVQVAGKITQPLGYMAADINAKMNGQRMGS